VETLILKLNAAGDVVRTTTLLHLLDGSVTWITAAANLSLLQGIAPRLRCLSWESRTQAADRRYDLVVSLEDEPETARFLRSLEARRIFGAYLEGERMQYTDDARGWFDLSLISRFGRDAADALKLRNRRSYQDLLFEGLGARFAEQPYLLPAPAESPLTGDVAIAPMAGPVWPMKGWAYYGELVEALERRGLRVNELPRRASLLEHLGDIANHRCLVSGDSLPMHLALGMGVRCVTLFNCTSPWEIHDYGLQTQMVSPLLEQFFYKRGMDPRATSATRMQDVLDAVLHQIQAG
jgi:heptosyltransferase-2